MMQRCGYGSAFNDLYIEGEYVIKVAKNKYGEQKLKNEYEFYKYIIENNILFAIPTDIEFSNKLKLTYYKDYLPLYKVYTNLSLIEKNKVIELIHTNLSNLHSIYIPVLKEQIISDLQIETEQKLIERVSEIKDLIESYSYIKYVNNIQILSFSECLNFLRKKINEYIEQNECYRYSPIHGDNQFNNILIDSSYKNIIFIDPRGYFGKSKVFGLAEYDLAKLQFALSGYDILDNMNIEKLEITDDHLYLPTIALEKNVLGKTGIIRWLFCSIWLGNAHCFKNQPLKAIFSYYYALYICTLAKIEDSVLIK